VRESGQGGLAAFHLSQAAGAALATATWDKPGAAALVSFSTLWERYLKDL